MLGGRIYQRLCEALHNRRMLTDGNTLSRQALMETHWCLRPNSPRTSLTNESLNLSRLRFGSCSLRSFPNARQPARIAKTFARGFAHAHFSDLQ
jgi:hypothetical protein